MKRRVVSKIVAMSLCMVMSLGLVLPMTTLEVRAAGIVIVLDPGHGGYDSGATYNGLLEKDVNLKVAQYCKSYLEHYSGVEVYMTRYDDTAPGYPVNTDLVNRVDIAQQKGARAIVSVHMNSGGGSGVEVYYPNANGNSYVSTEGRGLADRICKNIAALGMNNRGIKIRNSSDGSDYYSIIRNAKERGFVGIIVEHGFMDGDYNKLRDDNFLRQLGEADAKGIAQYYGLVDGENLKQYEGAFNADNYRAFNPDVRQFSDQQCFQHWMEYGIWEDRNGSMLFNMSEYMDNNPDLVAAFGWDFRAYARHFSEYGMSEGRSASDGFSVWSYKNRYRDLRDAFGNDLRSYYLHYNNCGWIEGRETEGYDNVLIGGGVSNIWIVDFSDVYDYDYYLAHNRDLKNVYGINDTALIIHFYENGMREGRPSSPNFDLWTYINRYEDLRDAFGWDLKQYYLHYMQYGKYEGRTAK